MNSKYFDGANVNSLHTDTDLCNPRAVNLPFQSTYLSQLYQQNRGLISKKYIVFPSLYPNDTS